MRFEMEMIVDHKYAIDVRFFVYQHFQYLHQIRFVIVPTQTIRLSFAATHFAFVVVSGLLCVLKNYGEETVTKNIKCNECL